MTATATPDEAVTRLRAGNERFVTGTAHHPHQDAARRAATRDEQHPYAVVLSCSDSRVAPEIVFDQGLGDLFVVRTAGHVVDPAVLGSVEFGADVLGCPLVVVLGHEGCGAVGGAVGLVDGDTSAEGAVRELIERVVPSVLAARRYGTADPVDEHVRRTVDRLADHSPVLARRLTAGAVALLGMTYRPEDGSARPVVARGLATGS